MITVNYMGIKATQQLKVISNTIEVVLYVYKAYYRYLSHLIIHLN